jgi:Zn-finger nucleic acid-binding protein
MNIEKDPGLVHLELKYCERCGGLWLRPAGTSKVYCGGCAPAMSEMAVPVRRNSRARLPGSERIHIKAMSAAADSGCAPTGAAQL